MFSESVWLRCTRSRVSSPVPLGHILITPGAISANFLLLYTLIGPGDHVVCVYPTYQQLYSVPESLGAEVSLWKLQKEKKFIRRLGRVEGLSQGEYEDDHHQQPEQPNGSHGSQIRLARSGRISLRTRDIIILSDEVYRPLFHSISPADEEFPPSMISMGYEKTIVTGSMSKAYSGRYPHRLGCVS